jgi:hypothetical protein
VPPTRTATAPILRSERSGIGCVIGGDGLVFTIGYLITDAQRIWITDHRGRIVPGHALGVDFASGPGLVLPVMPLDAPAPARTQHRGGHRRRSAGARSRRHRLRTGGPLGSLLVRHVSQLPGAAGNWNCRPRADIDKRRRAGLLCRVDILYAD